jgi:hypothetical protein
MSLKAIEYMDCQQYGGFTHIEKTEYIYLENL